MRTIVAISGTDFSQKKIPQTKRLSMRPWLSSKKVSINKNWEPRGLPQTPHPRTRWIPIQLSLLPSPKKPSQKTPPKKNLSSSWCSRKKKVKSLQHLRTEAGKSEALVHTAGGLHYWQRIAQSVVSIPNIHSIYPAEGYLYTAPPLLYIYTNSPWHPFNKPPTLASPRRKEKNRFRNHVLPFIARIYPYDLAAKSGNASLHYFIQPTIYKPTN